SAGSGSCSGMTTVVGFSGSGTAAYTSLCFLLGDTLLSSEILVVARACYSKSTSQRELGKVVAVETVDVLIVGAGEGLLGLDHFDAISYSGTEAISGPSKALIGKFNVLLRHLDLLLGGVKVEKSRPHVIVNLSAKIFGFGFALPR